MIYYVVGGLLILAWHQASKLGKETTEREEIFLDALEHLTDPEKLRKLADAFEREGLHVKAVVLRKRADLRALPYETKLAHRAILRKALASTNIPAMLSVAKAFEDMTATGSALQIRNRISELRSHPPKPTVKEELKVRVEAKEEVKEEVKSEGFPKEEAKTDPAVNGASKAVEAS